MPTNDLELERFISALRIARAVHPKQRIGQLLMNALPSQHRDLFYVTDARLNLAVSSYAGHVGEGKQCAWQNCINMARAGGRMCSEHFNAVVKHGMAEGKK